MLDNGDGANTTLREAIEEANFSPNLDTIKFDETVFGSGGTIVLTHGGLGISESVMIDGTYNGVPLGITIDGNDPTPLNENPEDIGDGIRIFNIVDSFGDDPPEVTMKGLTLRGADTPYHPITFSRLGGAIFSQGLLTLEEMTIVDNYAGEGAGVYIAVSNPSSVTGNRVTLSMSGSTFESNVAAFGGAISIRFHTSTGNSQSVEIIGSTLSGNTAINNGGAISIFNNQSSPPENSTISITSSELTGNKADNGGAIFMSAARVGLTIQDSEISGNYALEGSGGGIYANMTDGQLEIIENSIVHDNHADHDQNSSGGFGSQTRYLYGFKASICSSPCIEIVAISLPSIGIFIRSTERIWLLS